MSEPRIPANDRKPAASDDATMSPRRDVSDPHPGSISDGTRSDADESGKVQQDQHDEERRRKVKREQAVHPALMPFGDPSGAA